MQKFGKEKTGPGNDMSSTKGQLWSCREEGKSCTPQGDGWATCFSGSQKPSTLNSVQYEHYRDANPSLPSFKQKFWSSGLLLCHTEWRQSPAPKLNPPSETNQIFLWGLALSCTHNKAEWEDGHWDAQICCEQEEGDREEPPRKC